MKRYAALLALFAVLAPVAAFAGANVGAAILIGTGTSTKTTACSTLIQTTCAAVVPTSNTVVGPNNFAAVYVGREPLPMTVTGIDFGIQYSNAILVSAWNKCGDLEVPDATWPASGSGISMVWAAAQTGNVILVGWFKVTTYAGYGPMTFQVGLNPTFNACQVLDASSNFDALRYPAIGTWDGLPGSNPDCLFTAVQHTTWGNIKNMYQN